MRSRLELCWRRYPLIFSSLTFQCCIASQIRLLLLSCLRSFSSPDFGQAVNKIVHYDKCNNIITIKRIITFSDRMLSFFSDKICHKTQFFLYAFSFVGLSYPNTPFAISSLQLTLAEIALCIYYRYSQFHFNNPGKIVA